MVPGINAKLEHLSMWGNTFLEYIMDRPPAGERAYQDASIRDQYFRGPSHGGTPPLPDPIPLEQLAAELGGNHLFYKNLDASIWFLLRPRGTETDVEKRQGLFANAMKLLW